MDRPRSFARRPSANRPQVRNHLDVYRRLAGYATVRAVCAAIGEEYLRQHGRAYRRGPDGTVGVPDKTWYAWVSGRMPRDDLIGPLTMVLRATRQLCSYPGEYTGEPPADPSLHVQEEEAMERRRVLTLFGTAAALIVPSGQPILDSRLFGRLAGATPAHAAESGVESGAPDRLEAELDLLSRGGWTVPAARLLPLARSRLTIVGQWRDRAGGGQVRRELDRLLGEAALVVAWLAYSSNEPHLAAELPLVSGRVLMPGLMPGARTKETDGRHPQVPDRAL